VSEIRNPEWPLGITLRGWLAHELWREYPETGTCKSCGRAAMTAIKGHDGFCPVPFLVTAQARIEALEKALPVKDAEGLARVCMSFAADMLHKQDDIGQRFWIDQAKRLRAYVTLRGEEET